MGGFTLNARANRRLTLLLIKFGFDPEKNISDASILYFREKIEMQI